MVCSTPPSSPKRRSAGAPCSSTSTSMCRPGTTASSSSSTRLGENSSGYGEGEVLVGATSLSHTGGGVEPFAASFAGSEGDLLTATATADLGPRYGSTSEFSLAVGAVDLGKVRVNSTGDASDLVPGDDQCDTGGLNAFGLPEVHPAGLHRGGQCVDRGRPDRVLHPGRRHGVCRRCVDHSTALGSRPADPTRDARWHQPTVVRGQRRIPPGGAERLAGGGGRRIGCRLPVWTDWSWMPLTWRCEGWSSIASTTTPSRSWSGRTASR